MYISAKRRNEIQLLNSLYDVVMADFDNGEVTANTIIFANKYNGILENSPTFYGRPHFDITILEQAKAQ